MVWGLEQKPHPTPCIPRPCIAEAWLATNSGDAKASPRVDRHGGAMGVLTNMSWARSLAVWVTIIQTYPGALPHIQIGIGRTKAAWQRWTQTSKYKTPCYPASKTQKTSKARRDRHLGLPSMLPQKRPPGTTPVRFEGIGGSPRWRSRLGNDQYLGSPGGCSFRYRTSPRFQLSTPFSGPLRF